MTWRGLSGQYRRRWSIVIISLIVALVLGLVWQTAGAQDATPTPANINTHGDTPILTGNACDGVPTPTVDTSNATTTWDEVSNPCYNPFPPCGKVAFNIAIESPERKTDFHCEQTKDGGFSFKGSASCDGTEFTFEGISHLDRPVQFNAHLTCPGKNKDETYTAREKCDEVMYVEYTITKHYDTVPISLACNPIWAATPTS